MAGTPGRSLTARLVPHVPAIVKALVDARRRWASASLAMGAALFAVATYTMVRAPAFAHVVPDGGTFVAGLILTLAAAVAGGWAAAGLAARFASPDPTSRAR
jgi:hypothetical protein